MSDFRSLLETQVPKLRRYARALTRNVEQADDLVQDTLLRALAKEHLWQPDTNLRAWLFTLMHNQFVNNVRRSAREGQTVEIASMSNRLAATTDPMASRQLHELERALAQLSDEQRETVLLVGLEGLSYEETSAIVGAPVGPIRSRLSRAREHLRRLVDVPERAPSKIVPLAQAA